MIEVFRYFEYRAVGGRIIWERLVNALSPEATSVAVDLGEVCRSKIVVFELMMALPSIFILTVHISYRTIVLTSPEPKMCLHIAGA